MSWVRVSERESRTGRLLSQHIMPLKDLREHHLAASCWCTPTADAEAPSVFVHHSMDRREEYEAGRKVS